MMQAAIVGTLYRGDRQADRFDVHRPSTLRAGPGQALDAIIQDLSACGCRIHGRFSLRPGETVQIGLAGVGVRAATVVWTEGDVAGCEFAQWLSYEDIKQTTSAQTIIDINFRAHEVGERAIDAQDVPRLQFRSRIAIILAGGLLAWFGLIAAILMVLNSV
jgi:hypothetical protein